MAQLQIRQLTTDDLTFADSLRAAEGWNQTDRDWRRLLAHQPEGCFIAEWNGEPAGVVTTTIHGGDLGWIGMMLVQSEFRRRGIATALIEHCLSYLQAEQVTCIKLDATPAGTPVYERLGFRTEWSWQRRARHSDIVPRIDATGPQTFPAYAWDRDIFGADRSLWLSRVVPDARVVCHKDGFVMLRQGSRAGYLGPMIARSTAVAEQLIHDLRLEQEANYLWDIPVHNQHGIDFAESLGFRAVRDLNRMWTGSRLIAGQPEFQYGYSDPGTG